ncbi:MAG: hypothetical protein ACK4OO_06620 [bacterium]
MVHCPKEEHCQSFRIKDWTIWWVDPHPSGLSWDKWADDNWASIFNPSTLFKDDHRSRVGVFRDKDGKIWVSKHFLLQERWWWFRVTSIWFPSLGWIAFSNIYSLERDGFFTTTPALLIERRLRGMVVNSILVYPYIEGELPQEKDGEMIVDLIYQLHMKNWVCRDPHPLNFLKTNRGLVILDPLRFTRTRSRYLKAYDVVLIRNDISQAFEIYSRFHGMNGWFLLALGGHQLVRGYRRVKHFLQALVGYSPIK